MARSLLERIRALEGSIVKDGGLAGQDSVSASDGDGARAHKPVTGCVVDEGVHSQSFTAWGFEEVETPYGNCRFRKQTFDLCTHYAGHRFAELQHVSPTVLERVAKASLPVERLRFYDTETNGLGTGAGTMPFLHSLGYFEEDELVVMQYFVHDYDAESAVLFAMEQAHLTEPCVIVTFNGKSFDWPLLQSRRRLRGMGELDFPQLDLLHPSRRLWRRELSRVGLQDIERGVLLHHRLEDLPGSEAPKRYFEFLDTGDYGRIAPVLQHNLADICTLVSLQIRISQLVSGHALATASSTYVALASWAHSWQDEVAAAALFRKAIDLGDQDFEAHWLYSLLLKRGRKLEDAVKTWCDMVTKFPESIEPLVELAKYDEHRTKDFSKALQWVEEAIRRGTPERARFQGDVLTARERLDMPYRVGGIGLSESRGVTGVTAEADAVVAVLVYRRERIRRKMETKNDESLANLGGLV